MTVEVSVIVPCFNQSAYVRQAVSSALEQTFVDLEVIVVDDGSTDVPAAALGELLDDSRLIFIRQENHGVAVARNVAIARSRGRFLHFLDADDWIAPEMLRTLMDVMIRQPSLGMSYCDITHVDAAGLPLDDYSVGMVREQLDGNLLPSLLVGGYFPPVAVLVLREAIDRVGGFDGALGGCCDWDVWSRIASQGYEAAYVDRKLAFYRIHAESMSRDTGHMSETMRMALRKLMHLHPDQAADSIDLLIGNHNALFKRAQSDSGEVLRLNNDIKWHQEQVMSMKAALDGARHEVDRAKQAYRELEESKVWLEAQVASPAEAREAREATRVALQDAHDGHRRLDQQIGNLMAEANHDAATLKSTRAPVHSADEEKKRLSARLRDFEIRAATDAASLDSMRLALSNAEENCVRLDEAIRWHMAQNESLDCALSANVAEAASLTGRLNASRQVELELGGNLDEARQVLQHALRRMRYTAPLDPLANQQSEAPSSRPPGVSPFISAPDRNHFERYVSFVENLRASKRFRLLSTLNLVPHLPRTNEDPP